jgi:hypothetical protein
MRKQLFASASLSLGIAWSASADIWFVDDSVISSGNGTTWAQAFKTLREALTNGDLGTGDEIRVGQGTYKPTSGNDRSFSFVLVADVNLLGGWAGLGASNPDAQNPALYLTILSGDIGNQNDYSDNSYHVVTADVAAMTPQNTLVDGFIITKGNGDGSGGLGSGGGGGIKIADGASPRFDRCVITANRSGSPQLEEYDDGFTTPYGAGVQISESSPVFTRCVISSNQNHDGVLMYGGGVVVQGDPEGEEGPARFIDCTITGNRAPRGGGLAVKTGGTVKIVNCLFTLNTYDSIATDPAMAGGAISIDRDGEAEIINCTIAANTSDAGGGIAQYSNTNNTCAVHSTIVWGNSAATGPEIFRDLDPGTMSIDYSDIRDRNGSGVVDLANSISYGNGVIGENTTTDNPDFFGGGDYHLACSSPCINAGHPTTTIIPFDEFNLGGLPGTSDETPDLDLLRRVVGTVDMGVYENQVYTCQGDIDHDCDVDADDLVAVILQWGDICPCSADVEPALCGDGDVDADDLTKIILTWGICQNCSGYGIGQGATIEDYQDCVNYCGGLNIPCMQACFQYLCEVKGLTQYCD